MAHAGDLYDKAHGDSMRAEKALKAPGLDDFGFPHFFGGRKSDFQEPPQKKLGRVWVCCFWFCFLAFLRDAVICLVAN